MILVDTSVWVDHLHSPDRGLMELLSRADVLTHPMVIGELALGSIANRAEFLRLLSDLPTAVVAEHDEVIAYVEANRLFGCGLSLVDVHLLASVRLTGFARLWTRDRRLKQAAVDQNLAWT